MSTNVVFREMIMCSMAEDEDALRRKFMVIARDGTPGELRVGSFEILSYVDLINIDRSSAYHVWRERETCLEKITWLDRLRMTQKGHFRVVYLTSRTKTQRFYSTLLLIILVWTRLRTSMWHGISCLGKRFVVYFFPRCLLDFTSSISKHKGSIESWTDQWNTIPQVWSFAISSERQTSWV
jgi:hypothetical protein